MKEVKKNSSLLFLALSFILIANLISAVEVEIDSEYNKGETMIAKFSGNFVDPILDENIFFYRDHVRVPMQFDVTRIEEEYYVYAILPENEANYSISIEEVRYYQGSKIIDDKIVRNFSIKNETAPFYVVPGFIVTSESFSIKVQSLSDKRITIKIMTGEVEATQDEGGFFSFFSKKEEIVPEYDSIEVKSGEIKNIYFDISNLKEDSFTQIVLSSEGQTYEVPLFAFAQGNVVSDEIPRFRIDPPFAEIKTAQTEFSQEFILKNIGDVPAENITLTLSNSLKPFAELSTTFVDELRVNQSLRFEVFFKPSDDIQVLEGGIDAVNRDARTDAEIIVFISEDYIGNYSGPPKTSCFSIGGEICAKASQCSGPSVPSSDGNCCMELCLEDLEEESKSSIAKVIGWFLILLIVFFIFWFYKKKYKGTKNPVDLLSQGKRK